MASAGALAGIGISSLAADGPAGHLCVSEHSPHPPPRLLVAYGRGAGDSRHRAYPLGRHLLLHCRRDTVPFLRGLLAAGGGALWPLYSGRTGAGRLCPQPDGHRRVWADHRSGLAHLRKSPHRGGGHPLRRRAGDQRLERPPAGVHLFPGPAVPLGRPRNPLWRRL